MSQAIRILTKVKGFTEAWYQLSEDERQSWWDQLGAITDRAGGKWLVMCDSRWANEECMAWGVLEFPTLEAAQQAVADNEKAGWYRYVVATTLLGSELPARPGGLPAEPDATDQG